MPKVFALLPLAVFVLLTTCGVMSDVELSIEEANILAEFFVATQYHNSTAVTPANACTSWINLVTCTNKSDGGDGSTISSLYFNRQSLTGTIPRSISNLTQLHTFVVSDNILYGTLPPELSNWNASLKMFDVSSNRITGTLPALYSSWTMLTLFNVSYNLITGTLPRSYSSWSGLHSFLASFNDQLDGPIPNEWAREWRQIASFQVASNSLTGTIPDFFSNSTTLLTFDVSLNFLTGAFPSEFHRNSPLQLMSVHHNSLSGTLPAKIAPMLTALSYFSVATNYFTGTLPLEYAQWGRTIVNFDVGGNQLTGTLPPEYSSWTSLNDFRTTSNQFYGNLPAAYAAWGSSLLRFNVRNNTLTGPIPSVYALWSRVESFDVGINSLSGSLPSNFSQWGSTIDRISVFSNRLHDSIPESWGSSMITLTRLLAGQNNFSSSLKAGSFPNIVVLSVSFNNISGVLPGLHSWPQLRFLDVQNNSLLTGSIVALSFVVSSICFTELCATTNIPNFARYACFPKDVSADDIGSDPSEVLSFATRYPFSPFLCSSTTTMAPSATPGQPSTLSPNSTAEVRAGAVVGPLESTSVAVGIVTSTVALVSTLGAVDAADAQMLVSILGSPCVCITRSPTQKREGSVLLIALSPFSSLGSAWAAIGNSLLCGVLVGLHVFCLRLMSSTRSDASLRSSNGPRNIMNRTLLGRWIAERGSVHCGDRRTLLARLRFPNLSVTFLLLLVPGIVHSVVDVSNQLASSLVDDPTGDDNQTSVSQELHASALAVGVVCITAAVFFAEIVAYRHVEYEVSSLSSAPSKRGRRHFLRFAFHENPTRVFAPFPRSLSTVVFPRGVWAPAKSRRAYGGIVSSYVGRWRRAWVVALGGNLAVQVLSSIDGSGSSCDALQSLTLCVLAGVCVFIAYARPHRALLASYLVCASLVLTMVTALLGLLCRHGAVSEDAVSGFGVFASVAMFVFKALNGALFIGEKKLLRRNNISYNNENDDSEMKTRPTRDSTVSPSVISARQTPNRHRGQHPAQRQPQFAEVIATDVKVQQRETRQSKITVEQVERLQKLIEMACGVLASNRIPTAHHR